MKSHLSFILNNLLIETEINPATVILDFIRNNRLTGTKEGCKEGDCGACTILVGEILNDKLIYKSVNSCLLPVGNVSGKHLVTIEGINCEMNDLNPIQRAFVNEGATQCGFCTPGFIVSMTGCFLNNSEFSENDLINSLDGNICRCTGHNSIIRAAEQIYEKYCNSSTDKNDNGLKNLTDKKFIPEYFLSIKERLEKIVTPENNSPDPENVCFIGGGTDLFVQKPDEILKSNIRLLQNEKSLGGIKLNNGFCEIGSNTSVSELQQSEIFQKYFPEMNKFIVLFGSLPIRNNATVGGNLNNASPIGDMTNFFMALNSIVTLTDGQTERDVPLNKYYLSYKKTDRRQDEIMKCIKFKLPEGKYFFNFEKVSKRTYLDIASVNTSILLNLENNHISDIHLSAGGVWAIPLYLFNTCGFLKGKELNIVNLKEALVYVQDEISPISDARGSADYKRLLLTRLIYTHFISLFPEIFYRRILMKDYDMIHHVRGESQYIDDINVPNGTLYASVFYSPVAHGKILKLDLEYARSITGVIDILTCSNIPGENQIGGIIPDEPLLANDEVHYIGMPVAVVIAETQFIAREAVRNIKIEIENLPVVTDPRLAFVNGDLIIPPRVFSNGNVENAWNECDFIIEGSCESGGQEHLYLETQGAFAFPVEGGGIKIISSTQGPTAVQRVASKVLGIPMNKIEVEVLRLGGGFGGKEDQASPWAAMAALAAMKLNRPVKLILPRHDDMVMTGKRNPYSSDFKIGLTKDGMIKAYEAVFYQNSGASADLSPPILDRTLFHCTNAYYIPNVKATGYCCRTNLPPNTAFRGFGGPQGKFVIECAIHKASEAIGIEPYEIQKKNLLTENDEFHYGQKAKFTQAKNTWDAVEKQFRHENIKAGIDEFNSKNKIFKKGFAFMPICFGIAFTNTRMNQANALVNIYTDGSVSFSTAAVEMGQGVNAKIKEIVSRVFSIGHNKIKNETTNTTRNANTSPTAASSGADLNCGAVFNACSIILDRLKSSALEELNEKDISKVDIKNEFVYYDGVKSEITWEDLIEATYTKRISLSAHAHFATPEIFFDRGINKGQPFRYHVYGTAIIEATVDCLRGTYVIDSVKAVHDFGNSLNPVIDKGQAEGAVIQGIGWMTIEEIIYNKDGKLLTDLLSTYKVPDIHFAPKVMDIRFLDVPNPSGMFNSKAVGEPPLMYGIGAYFAILNAVKAFRPGKEFKFSSPITPEKVLLNLYDHSELRESIQSSGINKSGILK